MPTLIEETEVRLEMTDLNRRVRISSVGNGLGGTLRGDAEPRSSGVHLSGVLRYIAVKLKILEPGGRIEDELPLLPALGFAWEEFAVSLYPEIDHQPGEVCLDDIYMNCDGLGVRDDQMIVEEFKYTRKKKPGSGTDILTDKKNWLWLKQLQGYCCGYGATTARLHICYANGDCSWGDAGQPTYMRYVIEFEPDELASMWRMVQANKGFAEAERH